MTMQPDLSEPTKNKEDLLYFEKADFSTMRKINNASILEMMKYDAHLLDTPRICPTNLKDRFGELIARYISAEREGIEEELDYCLTQLSSLFLGSTSSEDVRDFRFMDLHLRVQRYLRNPIYRSHTAHLLGVCLFSNLLLEADIDLLTLARTEYFFQALRSFDINKPKRNQEESKPTYYPGDIGSEMDRGVYPSGELFAVKLRKYLERKEKEDFKKAVCFFFDPYIWINLYHDWGYIYELEHLYSEGIYKNNKPPEAIEEIINELNREKDEIEKEANFDLNRYFPNKNGIENAIENALDYILSPPFNKEEKKGKIKEILNSKNENEEAERALDYILSFPLCHDKSKKGHLRELVREKLSIKNNDEEIERALDYIPPSFDKLEEEEKEKQKGKIKKVVSKILTSKIKNHGIVSSLILYDKFLNIFKNAQVAERIPSDLIKYKEDALKDELGAICLHDLNLSEKGISLRLTDSPHYFLLKFADVISDWGRTYKGKVSLYDFSILDHILFGFNPTECTKPNGEKFEEDTRGILVNIIFDFSNNERLLADEIGLKDKSKKKSYPRKENYEFEEFVKKREELQSLDYLLEIDGKYLFSWDNISESAKERLRRLLVDDLDIDCAENAEISKSDGEMTISILKDGNSAEIAKITLDEKEEKATLKITDGKTYVLKVKEENGKLNIYDGKEYQWFFFNLILIDRYGERFLIENSKNNVDLWWIIPPLFSEKFKELYLFSWDNVHGYLFSWDNVPGNDSEKLLMFLRDEIGIEWAKSAEIHKSNDGKTIYIVKDENSAEIKIDKKEEKATLKTDDVKNHNLKIKKENGKLNIYVPGNDSERLLRFLKDDFDIRWAETAVIYKSDDGRTISISNDENSAEMTIDEKEEKATLEINNGRTHHLIVKKENGKLNIYKELKIKELSRLVDYKRVKFEHDLDTE